MFSCEPKGILSSPSDTHANGLRKLPRGIHTNSPPLGEETKAPAGPPPAQRRPSADLDPVMLQRQVSGTIIYFVKFKFHRLYTKILTELVTFRISIDSADISLNDEFGTP